MAEAKPILFDYREVVAALVKAKDIHEGEWMLYVEFGLAAINMPIFEENEKTVGRSEADQLEHIKPVAMMPLKGIGIRPADKLSSIAVDAAVVNPKPKAIKKK